MGGLPTARTVAAAVLVRVQKDGAFAAAALDAEVSRAVQLEPRDRGLATELVYGSLRVLPWLEARLLRHAPRGLAGIDPRTRAELLLSAYQLFFLARVPAFAAVNEAVEGIKQARGPRLANFANAVLRKLATEAEAEKGPALLLAAVEASLPPWLRRALVESLGEADMKAFLAAGIEPPPVGLRVASAAERETWIERLATAVPGATFEAGKASPLAILARGGGLPSGWPGEGTAWAVQEEGSQLIALALGAKPGERVLDACAGRGNKSTILARAVSPDGKLDAADVHPPKLVRLAGQMARMGLALHETYAVDWSVGVGEVPEGYDRALVDAPCSGIGTLRRRPDLLLRREPDDLARLSALQVAIALRVATRLRPGGRLLYAVCSVLGEEGEEVVRKLLAADPLLRRAPFDDGLARPLSEDGTTLRLLPHIHGTDGYFLASFERLPARS